MSVFLDETMPVLRVRCGGGCGGWCRDGERERVAGTGGGKKQGLPKITQNNRWKSVADTGSNQASAEFFFTLTFCGSALSCHHTGPTVKDTTG